MASCPCPGITVAGTAGKGIRKAAGSQNYGVTRKNTAALAVGSDNPKAADTAQGSVRKFFCLLAFFRRYRRQPTPPPVPTCLGLLKSSRTRIPVRISAPALQARRSKASATSAARSETGKMRLPLSSFTATPSSAKSPQISSLKNREKALCKKRPFLPYWLINSPISPLLVILQRPFPVMRSLRPVILFFSNTTTCAPCRARQLQPAVRQVRRPLRQSWSFHHPSPFPLRKLPKKCT